MNSTDLIEAHKEDVRRSLEQVIRAAGSMAALAEQLGVSYQAVQGWHRRGGVPLRRAVEIEAMYGVSRYALIDPRLLHLIGHTSLL